MFQYIHASVTVTSKLHGIIMILFLHLIIAMDYFVWQDTENLVTLPKVNPKMITNKIRVGKTLAINIPTKVLVAQGVGLNDLNQETLVPR